MHQLRPHLMEEVAFVEQVQRQLAEGYYLAYLQEGEEVKALAGFRFLEFLAWGKALYNVGQPGSVVMPQLGIISH